jgi:HK97 family phage portal protein
MRLPSFLRREPTFEDVAKHINRMPPEQVQYMSMLTKSSSFGPDFLSAVRSSNPSQSGGFLRLSADKQLKVIQNAALVHACVTTISSAFQEAPLTVEQREKDGTWKKTDRQAHEYVRVFKTNPDLSESEIMMYSVMNLLLTGKSFQWILRDAYGDPMEVWPIPSSMVTVVLKSDFTSKSPSRLIEGFRIDMTNTTSDDRTEGSSSAQSFFVPFEDMIYTKFPAPWNLTDGLSPLGACAPYVDLEGKGVSYTSNSLENLNLPGLVIKTDRQMTPIQKQMLRAAIAEKVGPAAAKAAMSFSGKDMTVDMVNPLDSFGWSDFHKLNETRICMAFKVPPIVIGALVGLEETTGWASGDMREAKKWLYRNTVHGLWKMFSTNIARSIIEPKDFEKFRLTYDATLVPELQEERGKLEERATLLFNASLITLNEAREMMLMKSIPDGDLIKTNLSNMFMSPDDLESPDIVAPDNSPNPGNVMVEDEEDDELSTDESPNEGK